MKHCPSLYYELIVNYMENKSNFDLLVECHGFQSVLEIEYQFTTKMHSCTTLHARLFSRNISCCSWMSCRHCRHFILSECAIDDKIIRPCEYKIHENKRSCTIILQKLLNLRLKWECSTVAKNDMLSANW